MRTTLRLIFFLSGVSALIFETLWFRLAGLSLGNGVWSASLVLAAFMGGIALGNALIARYGNRVLRPLMVYVVLELAIGIAGIAVVAALPQSPGFLGPLLGGLMDTPWLLNLVRLTIGFGLLVVPTTAMGATLPVLAQALSRVEPNFGATLGQLYGWNTLGAMLGAIISEVLLIKWLGLLGSGLTAMLLNFLAALLALRLVSADEKPLAPKATERAPVALSLRSFRYLLVAFSFGAILLALEVVWFRFLLLTHHGTSLIFAAMLTVVLGGIALGGLAAAQAYRFNERSHAWLRHTTALSGMLVVLTYYGFDLFTVHQILHKTTNLEFAAFATFLMFPVSLLSGMTFTMVGRALKDELGTAIRTTGIATLWNTIGAMLGSLCGGFVLLPLAGMERSFFILAAAYGVTALVVPGRSDARSRLAVLSAYASVGLVVVCLFFFPFGLMQRSFFKMVMVGHPDHVLIETREGLTETVFYYRDELYGAPYYYRLVTNGFSMSGTNVLAKRYMKLFVYLPLALKGEARNALLISYGVGSTAKALTDSASLSEIDVVDISRDILEMSRIVYADNENPLHDARVHVYVEDGRFFLNATGKRYDLITSEPPPPKIAGIVNLYSQEYFELIRSRLTRGGYATYWLPVHDLEPLDTLSITKAFCNAFQDCSLWAGAGLEWMLMGSKDAERGNSTDGFSAQWNDPKVRPELTALGFEVPAQLGSLFMGDAQLLKELTDNIPPVTDNYPQRISSRLTGEPRRHALYEMLMDENERLERFRRSEFVQRFWPAELREASEPFFRYERMIKNHFTLGLYRAPADPFLWEAVDDVLSNTELKTLPLWLLGSDESVQKIVDILMQTDAHEYEDKIKMELAIRYSAERNYLGALEQLRSYIRGSEKLSIGEYSLYLYLLGKNNMLAEADSVIEGIVPEERGSAEVQSFLKWFAAKFGESGE